MTCANKISVCMAVYNGEKFIRQQIESVLMQLEDQDELLIFDDVSTDETVKIATEFKYDARIKIIINPCKLGVIKNFECALENAKGDYIFLCDQDDVWMSNKVEECVAILETNLMVITDCKVVDDQLNEIFPSFFELRHSGDGILKNIWKNSYLGCCMAFRKELLRLALPIPKKIPMHDMWLGLIAQTQGTVLFLPQKLSLYRRHQLAISPAAGKSNFNLFRKFNIRVVLITNLLCRVLLLKFRRLQARHCHKHAQG